MLPSGPLPTEEAVKEQVSAITSALARKTRDAAVADIEATASELGRVAKAAAASSPADKCVAVLEAALAFADAPTGA